MKHRSGFVNIIGSPNVGKSTLMNKLVGERLSIITSKAQTTRHRILGMVNGEDFQIVYSDTPGIVIPAYKMHEGMMQFVNSAIVDADVLLVMVEIGQTKFKNEQILERILKSKVPVLLLINKIDTSEQDIIESALDHWKEIIPNAGVLPISAMEDFNTEKVLAEIINHLPEGEPFFPKDELTDKPERFFMAEIIREKIFNHYDKEIPYSCEVVIEEFKDDGRLVRIRAEIMVARESQKGILIGHQGSKLKIVGTEARLDMNDFLGKKVHLELFVKVNKNWRNSEMELRKYGYLNK